jgi:hypothetical protein
MTGALFRKSLAALAVLLLLAGGGFVRAADEEPATELEGDLEVSSAYAVPSRGVIVLSAHVVYPAGEQVSAALRDGNTLGFDLEVSVSRHRRLWFDAEAVRLLRHFELSYHVVSERFLLREVDGELQESFPTLAAALARLGQVDDWPIAVDSQLSPGEQWQIRLRAGVRRGHMPDALRALAFWSDAWHRTSDWYTWTLVR